jgi:peptidyl-prolyl cis-trans isomerase SurA
MWRHRCPRLAYAGLLAATVLAFPAFTHSVSAQQVVARVNGDPITAVDIAQRSKLIQASTKTAPSQKQVLDELIDEQLKIQTARRYRIDIPDSEVESTLTGMASRMRASTEQFEKALTAAGISYPALRRKIKADLAWTNIVRGKFQSNLQVRDIDVQAAIQGKQQDKNAPSFEYTLRPILLIVGRGGNEGSLEARRREAEGLRSRFQNCDDGIRLARGLRDVAVKDQITKTSGDLPANLRSLLDGMQVGRLTPPDVTAQGIEVFALCNKRETKGDTGAERDAREQLFGQKYEEQGKKYLRDLRRSATIEMR